MKIDSKFNLFTVLSCVLLIVNFLFTDKSIQSIIVLIISLAAIIAYGLYERNRVVSELETKISNLNKLTTNVSNKFFGVKTNMDDIKESSESELSKVDEISSALENTSMMVIRNKENTRQAAQLTQDVIKAVKLGNEEMEEMMTSINDIKSLSDEIQKIVKVIDDIAFQTNILALNAAVEAARAGDAGKGFAVVADEVRNLAQKSSDAVNNTSKIIDKNIISAENGVNISVRVEKALNKMSEEIGKVEELINEITASSEEQANEVVRTKDLASELDKIVNRANDAKNKAETSVTSLDGDIIKVKDALDAMNNGSALVIPEKDIEGAKESFSKETKEDKKAKKEAMKSVDVSVKSKESPLTDKEFVKLSVDPIQKVEIKPEAKVDAKNDDDDDDFFASAKQAASAPKEEAPVDNGFNTAAFKEAQARNVMGAKAVKSQAEAILPLDDSDGF